MIPNLEAQEEVEKHGVEHIGTIVSEWRMWTVWGSQETFSFIAMAWYVGPLKWAKGIYLSFAP